MSYLSKLGFKTSFEKQIWVATYAAAWVRSFNNELFERRNPKGEVALVPTGTYDATMESDHAEESIILADQAVLQLRNWKNSK